MRALSAAFALALASSVLAAGDARFRDGRSILADNPARGAAPGGWHVLRAQGNSAGSPEGFCSWLWNIGAFSGGNSYDGNPLPTDIIGGTDAPLTADALAAVSNTLVNARANGAMMIVRFGYTSGSETGAEPSDFGTLLAHISQLGPILGAFPDVVLAVECGMCGPWGEMHSTNYREPYHIRAITDMWLDSLAESTALLVRYPMWLLEYAQKDVAEFMAEVRAGTYCTSQPAQRRMGIFNDGYLGSASDYGTWRVNEKWMTRAQGVEYLEARRNVPYGGELAHLNADEADAVERDLFDVSSCNIVREFYRTHLCYLRNIDAKSHLLAERMEGFRLTHDHDFEGMPDLSEWYGCDLRSFVRTHMGYRFVVRDVGFYGSDADVTIENTGFGHLLVKSCGEISVGDASRSVGLDLRDLGPGERRTYRLPLPDGAPEDKPVLLTLRLDTSAAHVVRFANDAMRMGDAICLRGTSRILGGESNESNVGSASSPVAWSVVTNWTPAQVPCGMDSVNWAPGKTGSHRQAYVSLDGDCDIGSLTAKYRTLHLYRASGASKTPVVFTVNTQLGGDDYQQLHEVGSGVKLVLPAGSTLVCSKGGHTQTGVSVRSGGAAEILGAVQARVMRLAVADGGALVFAPSSYSISSWGRSDDDHDEINVSGGTVSLPDGIAMTGTSSTPSNQFNQSGGIVTFGGDFTSVLPWTYTWSGGTLAATDDVAFGANVALVIPASTAVVLDVAAGKTFAAPGLSADATSSITKTGGGVFSFAPTAAAVAVNAGGISLAAASTYDLSAATFSSGTTVELAVLGATVDSFDPSLAANATFTADLSGANVGTVVFSSADASLLAKVKSDLEGDAGFPGDKQLTVSGASLRFENKAGAYSFNADGEASILDGAGWGGSVPGAGETVSITGVTTVAKFTGGTFPQWAAVEVRDGATLRISADADLPQITLYPNAKLEIEAGTSSLANGLVGSYALVGETVQLPVLTVATNATLTVASGMKFKDVDFRLYGTVTKASDSDASPVFGYADNGETSYFAFTADGGVFDFHSIQNVANGSVSIVCPDLGGTVVPVGTITLRNASRTVNGWADFGNWQFGVNNPTSVPFDVLVDGTALDCAACFYASGAAHLSLVNGSCVRRNTHCLGHYFSQAIQDSATIAVGEGCYIDFTTGDGVFGIDSQSAVDTVTVRDGGVYAVSHNSSGWGNGVFVSDGGVLGVTKIYKSSSGDPRQRTDLLRGFASARLDGDLTIASVNIGGGNYDWDRHATMANVPFSGSGDVTITNGVPGYPFTVTMRSGANTATGKIKVAKADGDAETRLYFANGANWAGEVVADGNVALTNLTDAAAASTNRFGTLNLAANFPVRVWKQGDAIVAHDVLNVGAYTGGGRIVPVAIGEAFRHGDSFTLGKLKAGTALPGFGGGWLAVIGDAGDDGCCIVRLKCVTNTRFIIR